MRLIMMGTGPFAVPTLSAIYNTRHDVAALATAPLRAHRGKPIEPISSIRRLAERHGTPIFDPENINLPPWPARLADCRADLLVVCDYGQILAPSVLAAVRLGGINLHASLLPKYRGAAPINWAIYHGEAETGVTVIHMTPQLDAGPCIAQVSTVIGPDETAAELEPRLAELGAQLVCETIDRLEAGPVEAIPQDASLAGKAPRLQKTDGLVDWSRPAVAIKNHVRAMTPWPGSYTFWHRPDGPPMRLILGPVSVAESLWRGRCAGAGAGEPPEPQPVPGTVLEAAAGHLVIAAGEGVVMPKSIQPAGKRPMAIDEFLRGHRVQPGERFGDGEGETRE